MHTHIPTASIEALRQLFELNLESHKAEVADWLHSEEAEPVLNQILVNVPCAPTLH